MVQCIRQHHAARRNRMQTAEPPLETTEPVPDKLAITKDLSLIHI